MKWGSMGNVVGESEWKGPHLPSSFMPGAIVGDSAAGIRAAVFFHSPTSRPVVKRHGQVLYGMPAEDLPVAY